MSMLRTIVIKYFGLVVLGYVALLFLSQRVWKSLGLVPLEHWNSFNLSDILLILGPIQYASVLIDHGFLLVDLLIWYLIGVVIGSFLTLFFSNNKRFLEYHLK